MEDEAVSPVIGVILMVAITVVLAAVVFVLVSDLGGGSDSAPAMALSKDEARDRVEITSAASGADWSRISVKVVGCTQAADNAVIRLGAGTPFMNDVAGPGGAALNSAATGTACGGALTVPVVSGVTTIVAGDFLEFCSGVPGTNPEQVAVQLIDTTANSKVWEGTFNNVRDCAAPTLVLALNDAADRIDVTTTGAGADWNRLTVEVTTVTTCGDPADVIRVGNAATNFDSTAAAATGAAVSAANCAAGPVVQVSSAADPIGASDYLEFCSDAVGPGAVTITVTDTVASSVILNAVFTALDAC